MWDAMSVTLLEELMQPFDAMPHRNFGAGLRMR
jgi:hypothetical protein